MVVQMDYGSPFVFPGTFATGVVPYLTRNSNSGQQATYFINALKVVTAVMAKPKQYWTILTWLCSAFFLGGYQSK